MISTIDRRIFGGFVEHLGRHIYDGIFVATVGADGASVFVVNRSMADAETVTIDLAPLTDALGLRAPEPPFEAGGTEVLSGAPGRA